MQDEQFIDEVYEIAFGDNAIVRDFPKEEVLTRLKEFSDNALKWEKVREMIENIEELEDGK